VVYPEGQQPAAPAPAPAAPAPAAPEPAEEEEFETDNDRPDDVPLDNVDDDGLQEMEKEFARDRENAKRAKEGLPPLPERESSESQSDSD
jgi:hypothetical protein